MAAGNSRAPTMQQDMFSAFDEIVLDVQRLEREIYSEKKMCQKLNERLEELDAEETKVEEQTNVLLEKSKENFKKEVDIQAALDCITKTLQLEKDRYAGLRHQLDSANKKAVEQNVRLTAKEEKYQALWNSYKAVYESFPLVREVKRMTDLVEHDKIKLMQANYNLRVAHNQIVEMGKISELAKKVELVKLAEVFCEHAASEQRIVKMQRQISELQASVSRGMERKQQLLAHPTAKLTNVPAQATLPIGPVAAMPVASCTGQISRNIASFLTLQSLPKTPLLPTACSRQASLDIVRARYAKRSWPSCDGESLFSFEESQPNIPLTLEADASVPAQEMDYSLQNCQTPRNTRTKPTDVLIASQSRSSEAPMQVEISSQDQPQNVEESMEIDNLDLQNPVTMEDSLQISQPKGMPMEQNAEPYSQGLQLADSPQKLAQAEKPTQLHERISSSQDFSHANHKPNNHSVKAFPYQERVSNTDVIMALATLELPTVQSTQDLPEISTFKAGDSVFTTTVRGGIRYAGKQRPIIPGIPVTESRGNGRVAEVPPHSSEWPPSTYAPRTPMQEQGATPGVPDGNAATGVSGNIPGQAAGEDDNMEGAPSASQDMFQGSQEEISYSQHFASSKMSRDEYLKKLRQSPEFHYAPRLMFNQQELGSQQIRNSSPYFQPLVSEASAYRNQLGPSLRECDKQDHEHSKELSLNEQLQYHQQNEQFPSQSVQGQKLPSQQAQIQKPVSQPVGQQFSNQISQANQIPVLQFSNELTQGQQSHSKLYSNITLHSQQPQAQQLSSQEALPSELRSQIEFQQTKILDHGIAQTSGQYGSQNNATGQTTCEFGSQGNGSALTTNQAGTLNDGDEQTLNQFGSQGNNVAQTTDQSASQGNEITLTSSQFVHHTITSQSPDQTQDTGRHTPKQLLSQGNDVFYTPRQAEGDRMRYEIGSGDYEGSPLVAFPSPGLSLIGDRQGLAAPDLHDSSSNESFQYKSPCCSPPPLEPDGFGFMGSAPLPQTSMFGDPPTVPNESSNAQQKPRSEAFTFNFSNNSSKPSIFKLF